MPFYAPGTLISGRYEVASQPLIGGMGIVYICLDHQDNRLVALKTFKPEYLPDRAARDRFLREGTAWVELGVHPHVVCCYGVERIGDGTEVYLVLELIAKEQDYPDASLRAWLIPDRPLPVETALLFALQIARGMQHTTECIPGFVHRDLKPENVLVGADSLPGWSVHRLRVTDFGLVAVLAASGRPGPTPDTEHALRNTQLTHGIVGTPLYMAPEQWRGEAVGVYTDVYALGCILYEMISGQHAVQGASLKTLQRAHCAGEIQPLSSNVPVAVRELVTRCLTLEPSARYQQWATAEADLGTALATFTGHSAPETPTAAVLSHAERVAAGWSYNALGWSYQDIGKAEVARDYLERAAAAGRAEQEPALEGAALCNLGNAYVAMGDAERAIGFYEQALAIRRAIGDRHGEGTILGDLGNASLRLGDLRHAIGYYEQHLAIARDIGDRRGEGRALGNLGLAYAALGDARRVLGYYEQALAIARAIGDRHGEGAVLDNLGNAYRELGDVQRAIGYHEQALAVNCAIGDRHGEGNALGSLGNAYLSLGDMHRAIGYYEQRLEIAREIGDRRGEGNALSNLGIAYAELGAAWRAIGYFEQALVIRRAIGDRRGERIALSNLGNVYIDLGDARRAIGFYEQALAIASEVDDIDAVANASFNMALLYAQQGDLAHTLPLAQEAARIWLQVGHPNAQRAQQLVAQLQGGGPTPAQILQQFAEGIVAVVAGARGDRQARAAVEVEFARLTQEGWQIVEPIQRIWAGEWDEAALTSGLDESDALIVREILRQLQG